MHWACRWSRANVEVCNADTQDNLLCTVNDDARAPDTAKISSCWASFLGNDLDKSK